MKNPLIHFLTLLFIVTFNVANAQETNLARLNNQLVKITTTYPQEKIHLQLDKPYYAIGEDIWLKAYLVTAKQNEPSLLSKVMYIDLIDSKNTVKKKITIAVDYGLANGNISRSDSLISGDYRIRAYTNYMRNYSDDFFFEKRITIGNVLDSNSVRKVKDKSQELSLKFFPEGGNFVANIRSKIGVKALTADGLGANLSGYIVNSNKEKVAEFKTEHAGMGVFALTPIAKEKYSAVITFADGNTKAYPLPLPTESGRSLGINANAENINVRISSSLDLVNGNEVSLIAQANGVVYASFASKADQPVLTANIPKKNFPTGLVQFTLFDSESNPIAERLVFINHNDDLKIDIKNLSAEPAVQKKTELSVYVSDVDDMPIDGNFSVAVTDLNSVNADEDDETTILSNLLLTSDIKGFIEQPNYYFNAKNENREKYLDNLLLTQGWTRFVWQDIKTEKEPIITFRPEQSLEITGKILSTNKTPTSNAKVLMMSTTPGFFLTIDTETDAKGNFVFDGLNEVPDSASFLLQAKIGKDNKNLIVESAKAPVVNNRDYFGNTIDISPYLKSTKKMFTELNRFNKLDKGILLKQVDILSKKPMKSVLNVPNSANAMGTADNVISRKMLAKEITIFSALRKVSGVFIGVNDVIMIRNTEAKVILDGTLVPQYFLKSISVHDIEGIEVLKSAYNTSVLGGGTYLYVTTRTGAEKPSPATNTAKIKQVGFTAVKQFYSPDYDDPKTNHQMQDLRSTIYWNPNLKTDVNGKTNFNFFNASAPSTYRVTIEGIDAYGNIGRKVYTYEVKSTL